MARRVLANLSTPQVIASMEDEMIAQTGNSSLGQVATDMGDLDQVRQLADRVLAAAKERAAAVRAMRPA